MRPDAVLPGTDRLAVFAFLWAAATVTHHLAFPWWFARYSVVSVTLVATALLVLARPRSIAAFTALVALGLLNVVKQAPFHPNHILFEGFADVILLAALLGYRLRRNAAGTAEAERRDVLFDTFAAPLRIAYLLLFGFAFLHKLNRDFLDPSVSCAVVLADTLLAGHGLPSLAPWLREPVVAAVLLTEVLIPIGLLWTRTRSWAVILALLFHLSLAQSRSTPLYSFAAETLALLFLFTPPDFTPAISRTLTWLRGLLEPRIVRISGTLAAGVAVFCLFDADTRRLLWNMWALLLVAVFVICWRDCRGSFRIEGAFRVRPRVLWIFLVFLALNAFSPYLGLKTQTSFSMYSNLRTENDRTNHLILGRLDLTSWQDDLVQIIHSDLPALAQARDDDVLLTYFEFRREAGTADRDFRVEYRRGGELRTLAVRDGMASDLAAANPPAWWLRKIIRFRPVQREGPTRCRH